MDEPARALPRRDAPTGRGRRWSHRHGPIRPATARSDPTRHDRSDRIGSAMIAAGPAVHRRNHAGTVRAMSRRPTAVGYPTGDRRSLGRARRRQSTGQPPSDATAGSASAPRPAPHVGAAWHLRRRVRRCGPLGSLSPQPGALPRSCRDRQPPQTPAKPANHRPADSRRPHDQPPTTTEPSRLNRRPPPRPSLGPQHTPDRMSYQRRASLFAQPVIAARQRDAPPARGTHSRSTTSGGTHGCPAGGPDHRRGRASGTGQRRAGAGAAPACWAQ